MVVDTEENRREDADALAAAGLDVVVTAVRTVDEALAAVDQLAAAAGRPAATHLRPAGPLPAGDDGPVASAFVPIWRRPWMTINGATYGASLLGSIGIDLVTAAMRRAYPTVELDDDRRPRSRPGRSSRASRTTSRDDHVAELAAAFAGARVVRVDGEDLFWWGVRTPAARRTPGRGDQAQPEAPRRTVRSRRRRTAPAARC